jgi:hypothetical protein
VASDVVVDDAPVPDEHPAASSPTPIARATGATQLPLCIPINTLPCVLTHRAGPRDPTP